MDFTTKYFKMRKHIHCAMIKSAYSFFFATLFSIAFAQVAKAQPNGELLFKGNCASCHRPTDEPLTGPGLKGVQSRWAEQPEMLYEWVKNPQKVINSGNSYATKLYAEWKSSGLMPAQAVTNEEIDAIFAYVEAYTPPVAAVADGGDAGAMVQTETDPTPYILLIAAILLVVVFSLAGVKKSLQKSYDLEKGRRPIENESYLDSFKRWVSKNQLITALIIVVLLVAGLREVWHGLLSVGVYEDYKPEQPIWFSHKVHAGQNEINCVYCHNSAEKSKHAGIPSANVCMNCHTAVNKGSITGTEEIDKIYAAVGWDKEKREYTGETKPIKWVKVHNLPDHVYFNHSQHVVVGQLDCAQCHGEMKKETVARQMTKEDLNAVEENSIKFDRQTLTMGWCIDCHRQAEVQMADNEYYDEFHQRLTKEELKKYLNDDERITVKEIGGLECAKCHY